MANNLTNVHTITRILEIDVSIVRCNVMTNFGTALLTLQHKTVHAHNLHVSKNGELRDTTKLRRFCAAYILGDAASAKTGDSTICRLTGGHVVLHLHSLHRQRTRDDLNWPVTWCRDARQAREDLESARHVVLQDLGGRVTCSNELACHVVRRRQCRSRRSGTHGSDEDDEWNSVQHAHSLHLTGMTSYDSRLLAAPRLTRWLGERLWLLLILYYNKSYNNIKRTYNNIALQKINKNTILNNAPSFNSIYFNIIHVLHLTIY